MSHYIFWLVNVFINSRIITEKLREKLMPPKFFSKAKRNYSNDQAFDKNKKEKRVNIAFLLIGNNKIGIDVPFKVFNADHQIKAVIKENQGVWDRQEKMWVVNHKNYQNMLETFIELCKNKQYYCSKIPSFVYDAQLDMPLDLLVKINKSKQPTLIRYIDVQVHIDPQTLPFYDKLYDFQKQSLKFGIEHHGRLLLADEMGVGKTIQSLAIAFIYRYQWPLVIICPSTLRFNWVNQVMNWYGEFIKKSQIQVYLKGGSTLKESTKVLIISYQLAWKFKQIWSQFRVAIIDEAHYLKNSGCKRTDILVPQLGKKKRVILLTGTPAFARPRQIYNLASIIRPDVFYNFIEFGNRYCQPSRNPWSGAVQYNGCINSKQLFYLLKNKIMLRRLKRDVLTQLPDKQRQKITIETNKLITKEINSLIDQNGSSMMAAEDLIMEMFGLKNSGLQKSDDYHKKRESLMEAYRLSGVAKIQGVIQYILNLLQNDVKLLIFAHHRAILDKIEEQLKAKKYKSIRIDGEVDMAVRQQRVDIFQNNKEILAALLSISAAGVGLTLTASSTVIFAQLHWTPGMLIQAQDRAHRIGQKNCVNCHYLIGQGTLDSTLYNYLLKKINNVSTFVDGTEQKLQIEELSKGQVGKISKSALQSSRKQKQMQKNHGSNERKSFGINPIRKSLQLSKNDYNQEKEEPQENSQVTDISSELTNNPFKDRQDEETASLKSRKRAPMQMLTEDSNQQQISNPIRSKHRMKILTGKVIEYPNRQSQSGDSLKTSQIIRLIEEGQKLISKQNKQRQQEKRFYQDEGFSIKQTKSEYEQKVSGKRLKLKVENSPGNSGSDIDNGFSPNS